MKTNVMRILDDKKVKYVVKPHSRPVFTVEDAARERGVKESQIVKTMVIKTGGGTYLLALVPGHKRLSLKKMKELVGDQRLELASQEEVRKVTGYEVGAVAPIGIRRKETQIYVDPSVMEEEMVDISSGSPTAGIELSSRDLSRLLSAIVGVLTE